MAIDSYTIDQLFNGSIAGSFSPPRFLAQLPATGNTFSDGPSAGIDNNQLLSNFSMQDGFLQSSNFVTGSAGWKMDADGNLEANNAVFRGAISASTINIPNSTTPLFSVDASGNVVAQSLRRKDFEWFTVFESIDGYQNNALGSGAQTVDFNGANFSTGATNGSKSWLTKGPGGGDGSIFSWSKKRRMKVMVSFAETNSNNSAYIVTGGISNPINEHFGFFLATNGALKGDNADGATERQTDLATTLTPGQKYILEAVWDGAGTILYYVNGVLKATVVANVPSGINFACTYIDAYLNNTAAVDKKMIIYFYDFWQEG